MVHLLTPLKIGALQLKNRLVLPPMTTEKALDDGSVSQDILDFYKEKATGGYISLIIVEHAFVIPSGKWCPRQLSAAEDRMTVGLKKLAAKIHEHGVKAVLQLNHAGSATSEEIIGQTTSAPSAILNPAGTAKMRKAGMPRELTLNEIKEIVNSFALAAVRAKEAGFDGIEIHSAHGFLLNQFYSPLTNQRTDSYGGSVRNRIRIHVEIIEAVRNALGSDYPVLLRLGASDYMEGGATVEDSLIAAPEFEKAGVSVMDISGGLIGFILPEDNSQGYFSSLSEAIKKVIDIPVILTGGVTEQLAAERLLQNGKADLIGIGRAILQDSGWPERAIKSCHQSLS